MVKVERCRVLIANERKDRQRRDRHRPPHPAQGADGVPEVALRLAQVVRLAVGLPREELVGQLGVGAVRERL